MTKTLIVALSLALTATPAFAAEATAESAAVSITKGKMLMAADGARLGSVYRVSDDGAQIILDGRMVTVPGGTISVVNGKPTTSLTKKEVVALR